MEYIQKKRKVVTDMFKWHEQAQQTWDKGAENWHKSSKSMWETGSRSTIIPLMQQFVPVGSYVLDVGCGDGYGTYKLHRAGYAAVGIDLSERMIAFAKKRAKDEKLSFQQADLKALPFADNNFDAVMVVNVLEWTENPWQALLEITRVLKPHGKVCIAILGPTAAPRSHSYRRLYGDHVVCNTMMPWEFKKLAQENGFDVLAGQGVYKRGVLEKEVNQLPEELQQALSFLWLFMLEKQ